MSDLQYFSYLTAQARQGMLLAGLSQTQQARRFDLLADTTNQQLMAVQHTG
ncbi:hypothetical protein D3C85_1855770 [compost metagenome]